MTKVMSHITDQENITGQWLLQKRRQRSDRQDNYSALHSQGIWPRKVPWVLESP